MEKIVDLIATDDNAESSSAIKDLLYAKASEKIEKLRSSVATSIFDGEVEPTEES
tara:strand:+ start:661 stop:825 length:165 start_codon:yes stop_codon:yes gene_type:complete